MKSSLVVTGFLYANKNRDYWTGDQYHKNSSSQKEAASDLLQYLEFHKGEQVLDIGCGDGKISAKIAEDLDAGFVLGIDNSASMITFANQTFSNEDCDNLKFQLMAAEEIDFQQAFDLVVSFTTLQWITDHQLVIHKVKESLKTNGTFAVTIPMGLPALLALALEETISKEKWESYFHEFDNGWNFVTLDTYQSVLEQEGCTLSLLQVVKQEDLFPSVEVFSNFISQWFPYLRPLPTELKQSFMQEVLARYIELEPLDEAGRLHFKINRLEVVSHKE